MIVAEQKSLEEVKTLIGDAENVLVVGCGTCVTVCFAGGAREAAITSTSLRMTTKLDGNQKAVRDVTVQRQCEWEYLDAISDQISPESVQTLIPADNQILPPVEKPEAQVEQDQMTLVLDVISSINFEVMIISFLFFFLGGYLLYAALFAAIGSAVDTEADTQQFMMPVTMPLILAIIMAQFVIQNPDGPIAFWFSIIPLTSPVVMMVRIPFGVPMLDLYLSVGLLIAGFLGTTWLAAKIYRTGILMYGKKISYRELWKWLTYRP